MKTKTALWIFLVLATLFSSCTQEGKIRQAPKPTIISTSEYDDSESYKPFYKFGSGKFHIAVVQSGEYKPYTKAFLGTLNGLAAYGWMEKLNLPDDALMGDVILELTRTRHSDYVEFSRNLYFDFAWDVDRARLPTFQNIVSATTNEIDLIISFGTDATRILSRIDNIRVPVLGDSISNGVTAGIIISIEDSGKDFLTIRCDPGVYRRQVRLFHDIVGFKTLGVLYTDTPSGRSYAALADAEAVAEERGFEIVGITDYLYEAEGHPQAESGYLKALEELCPQVNAVYLTIQAGLTERNLPAILDILNEYKMPSFAMANIWKYVEKGILLGVSETELISAGHFNAEKIVHIFKGIKPRSLNQVFQHTPKVAINLETARQIGFDIAENVLNKADTIYGK